MASVESVGEGQEALDALKMTEYDEDSMDEDAERIGEEEEDDDEGEDDSSEEEDKREYGIYQCLPVEGGEPNWEEEEPQTVEEYLRRVRYEARHLPDVVTAPTAPPSSQQTVADAPHGQGRDAEAERQQAVAGRPHRASRYLAADPGVAACDPALVPSATWTRDFLHQFAQLRRRLQREHELLSGEAAAAAAPGGLHVAVDVAGGAVPAAAVQAELEALQLDPPSACMPELEALRGLDQLGVRRQLHSAMREAVRCGEVGPQAAARLYALSARVERPLHADTCALYRQLLRACAGQRAALGKDGAADPRLPHLNILLVLAGAFFGQDEELAAMWDDEE